ncbi:hypothetical protein S7711_11114 [Stachybotrys chartarum IBT 7711]|uniref:Uncharacterized protein n=1 Tax=Stachybotrys chartarum (strain CBS 109288 / IBT 7711) TaxID=1280523 RepID=A0A084AP57_STACB|nr:hypothetical protein S7711_11114 [Stachybotrys chartarum IBT 7711]
MMNHEPTLRCLRVVVRQGQASRRLKTAGNLEKPAGVDGDERRPNTKFVGSRTMIYQTQEVNAEGGSGLHPHPHPHTRSGSGSGSGRRAVPVGAAHAYEMQLIITDGFVRSSSDNSS